MPRVAIRFAYDGTCFPSGYARQPEGHTVEDSLIEAIQREGYVEGSWRTGSRTDRGVSALANVAACAIDRAHLEGFVPAVQRHLPPGSWMLDVAPVADDWNPRHNAVRTYDYIAPKRGEQLDTMARVAQCFEGEHNMSAFARVEPPRDPVRVIARCTVADAGDAWRFTVASPGFLWNQVRRMVDAMLRAGHGALTVAQVEEALETGQVPPGCSIASPGGLLLRSVDYAPEPDWAPEAGSLRADALAATWQEAHTRAALLDALHDATRGRR